MRNPSDVLVPPAPAGPEPVRATCRQRQFLNNANRLWKVWDRFGTYCGLAQELFAKGVPLLDLARTQLGRHLPDARKPPIVTIELTNSCNLQCGYCTNFRQWRTRGYMSEATFDQVLMNVRGLNRVRLVGNGEPTLHPQFPRWVRRLAPVVKHLAVVTNGHWKRPEITQAIIEAQVDLIEISGESDNQSGFALNRKGGDLELVLRNLDALRKLRDNAAAKSVIQVRVMIRPSDSDSKTALMDFWRQHADRVMCQYILRTSEMSENNADVFLSPFREHGGVPKCNYPFKCMDVLWDGSIPLCSHYTQCGRPNQMLGNINRDKLVDVWNSQVLREHRRAQRNRQITQVSYCDGCMGY